MELMDDSNDFSQWSDCETIEDLDNEAEYEASVDSSMTKDLIDLKSDMSHKYQILSVEQIVQLMNESIKEVISVIELPMNIIRILLNHFHWDKQKLLERYFDGNEEKLFSEAHIINPNNKGINFPKKKKRNQICFICYNEVSMNGMTSISCGHEFCISEY